MFNRLNQLSFVIGLFFSLMAVILAVHALAAGGPTDALSLYSAAAFLVFGIIMILAK